MTQYTIKYAGFDQQQRDSISAILDLADSALTSTWLVTENSDSDVAMINLDTEDGQHIFTTQQQNRPAYRIILVAENPEAEIDNYWFLAKKPYAPPSLKELTKLFNEVSVALAGAAEAALTETKIEPEATENDGENTPPGKTPEVDSETVNPEPSKNTVPLTRPLYARNYFFGILLQTKKDNDCRVIKLNKLPTLYISPTENSYYFSGSASDLLSYCTTAPQYLKETITTKVKLSKMLKSEQLAEAQSLDALIAFAVIEASQGRLLEGHSAEHPIKLTRLPDTSKIPLLATYKNIAEFIHNQSCNLFQVAEALQTPLSSIFEFYNACYLLGYLTTVNPEKADALPNEPQKSGKLGAFLKAFLTKPL